VVAFLGFPLDSFRVSLAMTASCAGLSVAKTITGAFGSKAGALFRRLEIYTGTNHSLTALTGHRNAKTRCDDAWNTSLVNRHSNTCDHIALLYQLKQLPAQAVLRFLAPSAGLFCRAVSILPRPKISLSRRRALLTRLLMVPTAT
jgi:hypothetical protein